jgi:lipoic acid synthetase
MSSEPSDEIRQERLLHIGKPSWLKTKIPTGENYFWLKRNLRARKLATVCEEAKCPNIATCWNERTATFMVLGDTCTRACRFCHVKTGWPLLPGRPEEPMEVAESCREMKLSHVVITMVDRDDLADGGAAHVAAVVHAVRDLMPELTIELLVGDFRGMTTAIDTILAAKPHVWGHNLETVRRLTPRVRDARASYEQSLGMLKAAKAQASYPLVTKSALMLGLGERPEEIYATMEDLRAHGVDLLTIGQYMRPSKKHLAIKAWIPPEVFTELAEQAKSLGFLGVAATPLARSSYRAHALYSQAITSKDFPVHDH